jgi:outer membrane factor, OMF family
MPPGRAVGGASALEPQQALPRAPQVKGPRPRVNPALLPPAATVLPTNDPDLAAPPPLALPVKPSQVRIRELRPLGLNEVETIAEVNNPNLKALAIQVEESQSQLRAEIASWYPTIQLGASQLPAYSASQSFRPTVFNSQVTGYSTSSITAMDAVLKASWALIDPQRTPRIAAARDRYEKAKYAYLIGLRDLRLQAAEAYFDLQSADEQVRIGQESVRASLVSLRDARSRFQAGVATKLEVLQAETQLARDQQLLTNALTGNGPGGPGLGQADARRQLASLLSLPQDVTPMAKDPSRVVGAWIPSLEESIIAAFAYREELDDVLLDISIANSEANAELAVSQPLLSIVNTISAGHSYGSNYTDFVNTSTPAPAAQNVRGQTNWNVDNAIGLNLSWNLFDGGRARALYRLKKQKANEGRYRFAQRRDQIRIEVERSFFELQRNNLNIATNAQEVLSTRESLRLARLRFQAGVTTQREVVDTQRDLTQAEVRYALAISTYNKSLADLRRRTGLDQIALCPRPSLPDRRPPTPGLESAPVELQTVVPACAASFFRAPLGQASPLPSR